MQTNAAAIWLARTPTWEVASSSEQPIFSGAGIVVRPVAALAIARALRRPLMTTELILRGLSGRDALAYLIWLDTAAALGIRRVTGRHGHKLPLGSRQVPLGPGEHQAISAVMMVQNEALLLPTALASLTGFADEIVIVDGGSDDGTQEIAKSWGARVVHRKFDNDFASQRNAGVALSTSPWIFHLDADEVLTADLARMLKALTRYRRLDGVFTPHLNTIEEWGDKPSHWPDRHLRLFRRELRYEGPVHEEVVGWRRAVYTPASGPFIVHRKSEGRLRAGARLYTAIDAQRAAEAERYHREGEGNVGGQM